jgi:hypothetical protein
MELIDILSDEPAHEYDWMIGKTYPGKAGNPRQLDGRTITVQAVRRMDPRLTDGRPIFVSLSDSRGKWWASSEIAAVEENLREAERTGKAWYCEACETCHPATVRMGRTTAGYAVCDE